MSLRSLGSDNHATVHPQIMAALTEVNHGQTPSYGTDIWSLELEKQLKKEFGSQTESFLVFNGTAANVLALRAMVTNYQSVFCSDISHVLMDECGAPEVIAGVKLIPIPSLNGKITLEALEKYWMRRGDQHYSQTQGISLTQPTELGTLYTTEELRAIITWSKKRNLKIHIDGARLANAAVGLNKSFREFTSEMGVDIISFGGTKNGLMLGELVIICNPTLARNFQYLRKQSLQLPSKSRYLAIQFLTYFKNELWKNIATHSLSMAQDLYSKIHHYPEIQIKYPVESNAIFPSIPKSWFKPLREQFFFYLWDEHEYICRWMTSWDTTREDIEKLANEILKLSKTPKS